MFLTFFSSLRWNPRIPDYFPGMLVAGHWSLDEGSDKWQRIGHWQIRHRILDIGKPYSLDTGHSKRIKHHNSSNCCQTLDIRPQTSFDTQIALKISPICASKCVWCPTPKAWGLQIFCRTLDIGQRPWFRVCTRGYCVTLKKLFGQRGKNKERIKPKLPFFC